MIDIADIRAADEPLDLVEPTRWWRWVTPSPTAAAALAAWAGVSFAGWGMVRAYDLNPLISRGVVLPLAIGVLGAFILSALVWRFRAMWLIGVAAGGYAGWCTTTIIAALNGTPFGYQGLQGDAGRLTALVTHFSHTWHNTDAADPSRPAEYPPLYPMILGRIAAITGRPGWTLLGRSQAILIGLVVVAGFLLWRRLVHPVLALVISAAFVVSYPTPLKANEGLAMVVLVPLLLGTLCPPPGVRRWNPVVAGVAFGLMVPWFPSQLMISILGIAGLGWYGWRTSADRRRYLVHCAVTMGVAFVVASWYIVPLIGAYGGGRTEVVADQYRAGGLVTDPLRLITTGGTVFDGLRLAGLVGTVLLVRRAWWAPPLALLLVGTQVLRTLVLLRFVSTGHAFVLFYANDVTTYLLILAGLLVTSRFIVWAIRAFAEKGPPRLAIRPALIALVAVFVSLLGFMSWDTWAPGPHGLVDQARIGAAANSLGQYSLATLAHAERQPDNSAARYHTPALTSPFDDRAVAAAVRHGTGGNPHPLVLSYDQRVFSYQDWRDWLPPDRTAASSLVLWNSRYAELQRLAAITDPTEFAAATARTSRGRIDVFYLKATGGVWRFIKFGSGGAAVPFVGTRVEFRPDQFALADFAVTDLPDRNVLVVRRP